MKQKRAPRPGGGHRLFDERQGAADEWEHVRLAGFAFLRWPRDHGELEVDEAPLRTGELAAADPVLKRKLKERGGVARELLEKGDRIPRWHVPRAAPPTAFVPHGEVRNRR
jgi:hypothetical protein